MPTNFGVIFELINWHLLSLTFENAPPGLKECVVVGFCRLGNDKLHVSEHWLDSDPEVCFIYQILCVRNHRGTVVECALLRAW